MYCQMRQHALTAQMYKVFFGKTTLTGYCATQYAKLYKNEHIGQL